MTKIEAIISKTKFEDVKEALLAADIEWFSYYDVRGEGKMRQARILQLNGWRLPTREEVKRIYELAKDDKAVGQHKSSSRIFLLETRAGACNGTNLPSYIRDSDSARLFA